MAGFHASAPGKIVLAGDYAVLAGAPALVMALDRRAQATVTPHDADGFIVDAPDLDIRAAHGILCDGHLQWQGLDTAQVTQLRLVAGVIEGLTGIGVAIPACAIALDTSAFFDAEGGKLGLGSSAALTVALSAALCVQAGAELPELDTLLDVHRAMQDGRGSGLDVATSLLGGLVAYQLADGTPQAERIDWPQAIEFACVWSGRSASTGSALRRLAQWQAGHAAEHAARMDELTGIAQTIAHAGHMQDAPAVVDNIAAYAASLGRLGEASGIDIVCAEHRALAALAVDCGVAYKSCGAGGGDVGMALATDPDRLQQFSRQVAAADFKVLNVGLDRRGLEVHAHAASNRRPSWTTHA